MSKKQSDYISANALKSIVKISGNDIVTATIRSGKTKRCKGYRAAERRAYYSLSKIIGGNELEDGTFGAVIRFRYWILLLLLLLVILIFLVQKIPTNANEREESTTEYVIPPETEETTTEKFDYSNMYITVPGYSALVFTEDSHDIVLNNPYKNQCLLRYSIYTNDYLLYESDYLLPGESIAADFYERLTRGKYDLNIYTRAFSVDKMKEFNSVYQDVILQVK